MGKQLRNGLGQLRDFYMKRLLDSGILQSSDPKLTSFTISELEAIYKKNLSPNNNKN
ncbi:Fur-regulated basic protein FbpA [Neobacillus pocheonensis]|uniref:Fur-regulated basic protein FbpA n=1 Tax=Neobacillus pocheonensis TaxID=363869 RepID=UPI003D2A23FE